MYTSGYVREVVRAVGAVVCQWEEVVCAGGRSGLCRWEDFFVTVGGVVCAGGRSGSCW